MEKIYSTRSAANILGVSIPTVRGLIKSGEIKSTQFFVGCRHKIMKRDLDDYLKRTGRSPSTGNEV